MLALTFDDGPNRRWTPAVLDVLRAFGARATFFPIAPRACGQASVIARMRSEGHVIGLHCDDHVRHSARDVDWCRRDADRALGRLASLGVRPALWRTPWGDLAPWSAQVAAERGLQIIGWDLDTHDWRGDSAEAMFAAAIHLLDGDRVCLAHDGIGPGALRSDAAETVGFVELICQYAGDNGIELVALGEDGRPQSGHALRGV